MIQTMITTTDDDPFEHRRASYLATTSCLANFIGAYNERIFYGAAAVVVATTGRGYRL